MNNHIGIRREDHNKWEKRVPLIPAHIKELIRNHAMEVSIQSSSLRIFSEEDFQDAGARIVDKLAASPIILGVKEIPLHCLEKNKAYMFFSHTIKGQPENMAMLKQMMNLNCTLIDYEKIMDSKGRRLVFFGTQAGQAGMIDTLWALGRRLDQEYGENIFSCLDQAFQYASLVEAIEKLKRIAWVISETGLDPSLSPLVCGFAGYGRVSQGAQEIFDLLPLENIEPDDLADFVKKGNYTSNRVYKVVFQEKDMVKPLLDRKSFDLQDYYENPENYTSKFDSYLPYLSILVNCIYWEPRYPRFVTKSSLKNLWENFSSPRLKVIGDISCDINGSIECTAKATSPDQPTFVYDPISDQITDGFKGRGVTVMSIDNLPAEIPLESSLSFSQSLKPFVPEIASADFSEDFKRLKLPPEILRAVILHKGKFTPDYQYLKKHI